MDSLKTKRPSRETCEQVRQMLQCFNDSVHGREEMAELRASLLGTRILRELPQRRCVSAGNSPRSTPPELLRLESRDCITPRRELPAEITPSKRKSLFKRRRAQSAEVEKFTKEQGGSLILTLSELKWQPQQQRPEVVGRLFEGKTINCRSLRVCGAPLSGHCRLDWIKQVYERLHEALGLTGDPTALAMELDAALNAKHPLSEGELFGLVNRQPCYPALAALSITHWANLWMSCLPKSYPSFFPVLLDTPNLCQMRLAASQAKNIDTLGDYAIYVKDKRLFVKQRKEVELIGLQEEHGQRPVYATLTIDLESSTEVSGKRLSTDWRVLATVHPPRYALDLPDKLREELQAQLDHPRSR